MTKVNGAKGEVTDLFDMVVRLSLKRGLKDIVKTPGLSELKVNDQWLIKINPHREEIDGIQFGYMHAEYEGLPVGVFTMRGGSMVGDGEDKLTLALNNELNEPESS